MTMYQEGLAAGTPRGDILAAYRRAKAEIEVDFTRLEPYAAQNRAVRRPLADLKWGVGDREGQFEAAIASIQAGGVPTLREHNQRLERPYKLSLSVGVGRYDPTCPCSLEELIARADGAMYEQKQAKKRAQGSR